MPAFNMKRLKKAAADRGDIASMLIYADALERSLGEGIEKALSFNEVKAKALVIGRKLEREDWSAMSGPEAHAWCIAEAKKQGAKTSVELDLIAQLAMEYVLAGAKGGGDAGASELDEAEMDDEQAAVDALREPAKSAPALFRKEADYERDNSMSAWKRLKAGEVVVVSDRTLDWLSANLPESEQAIMLRMASLPNPERVGTRDTYIASLDKGQLMEYAKQRGLKSNRYGDPIKSSTAPFRKAMFPPGSVDKVKEYIAEVIADDESVDPDDAARMARNEFDEATLAGITDEMMLGWAKAEVDKYESQKKAALVEQATSYGFTESSSSGDTDSVTAFTSDLANGGSYVVSVDSGGRMKLKYEPPSQERRPSVNLGTFYSFKDIDNATSDFEDENADYFHQYDEGEAEPDEESGADEVLGASAPAPFRKASWHSNLGAMRVGEFYVDGKKDGMAVGRVYSIQNDAVAFARECDRAVVWKKTKSGATKYDPKQYEAVFRYPAGQTGAFDYGKSARAPFQKADDGNAVRNGVALYYWGGFGKPPSKLQGTFLAGRTAKLVEKIATGMTWSDFSLNIEFTSNSTGDEPLEFTSADGNGYRTRDMLSFDPPPQPSRDTKTDYAPFRKDASASRFSKTATRVRKGTTCECADKGCPAHRGVNHCTNRATTNLVRVDMNDRTGTMFCDQCAADAMESGLFEESVGNKIKAQSRR